MTQDEMIDKLKMAQDLLSDVYYYAHQNNIKELASLMSCADTCIIDALENDWVLE